jgi:hypothetical protein
VQNNPVIFYKSTKNKAQKEFDIPHFEEHLAIISTVMTVA